MLKHIEEYATFRFFELYSMLYKRKKTKITSIGYYPIYIVLNYIKYEIVYKLIIESFYSDKNYMSDTCLYDLSPVKIKERLDKTKFYEDNIKIACNSIIGIEITFENKPINTFILAYKNGNEFNETTSKNTALFGQLECLKYAHENGCKWDYLTCNYASLNGHLDCLIYANENGWSWNAHRYPRASACHYASLTGNLDCLIYYANENGCQSCSGATFYAAKHGHLDCLIYLRENGCEWDEELAWTAIQNGHFNCFRYAHEHGCAWHHEAFEEAAACGDLECLKFLHKNWNVHANHWIAKGGCGDICYWDIETWKAAIRAEQFEILLYLYENECPGSKYVCRCAAKYGKIKCLKFLHDLGCPWDEETCNYAATYGQLECLKFLHINGCPFNKTLHSYDKKCDDYILDIMFNTMQ